MRDRQNLDDFADRTINDKKRERTQRERPNTRLSLKPKTMWCFANACDD